MKNVVITDKDFEQFIFVNRAAQKWKTKLKKNRPLTEEADDEKEISETAKNLEAKDSDKMNMKLSESKEDLIESGGQGKNDTEDNSDHETAAVDIPLVIPEDVPLLSDAGDLKVPETTVYDDGRFVTDV